MTVAPDVRKHVRRPQLRVVEDIDRAARTAGHRRRVARLHVFTYVVGNALFWAVWGAISISADAWYAWLIVPFACWTAVLAAHLWAVLHRR